MIIITNRFDVVNKDILTGIQNFNNDPEVQKLQSYYNQTTCMNVFDIEREENRHSAFLSWLFNDKSSHNLGVEPLRKLLTLYAICEDDAQCKPNENKLDLSLRNKLIVGKNYQLALSEITTEKTIGSFCPNPDNDTSDKRIDIFMRLAVSWEDQDSNRTAKNITLCIENKVYSKESDGQTESYHKALTHDNSETHDDVKIEIFLTPDKTKAKCEEFVSISYQEVLDSVIQPLVPMEMSDNSRIYMMDYIRNLGRADMNLSGGEKNTNVNSILAISIEEKKALKSIYEAHSQIFNYALVASQAKNDVCANEACVIEGQKYDNIISDIKGNEELLAEYWLANEDLFKAIIFAKWPDSSILKESNRDNSKYVVAFNDEILNLKKKNGSLKNASKAEAAYLLFKAWTMFYKEKEGKLPTLDCLRKEFPISINTYYSDCKYFSHLFYPYNDELEYYYDGNKLGKDVKITANWDIYLDKEHKIELANNEYAVCLKLWRKSDFENLVENTKKYEGITIEKVN